MTAKPVIPRERASRDIEESVDYYARTGSVRVALGLVDALEAALQHIANHPATGSPRHAHELDLAGLRAWPLKRYPYLVCYLEQENHIDVWRVLHASRDIPAWMQIDRWL